MLKFLKEPSSKKEDFEAEFSPSWFNEFKEEENNLLQSVKQKTVRFTSTDPEGSEDQIRGTWGAFDASIGLSHPISRFFLNYE